MFAQHMLAVLKDGGMMATVMPHGVLFRGGDEKEIRKSFIEDDLLEAVIGLPPNLFYGTGIPACILVMRRRARSRRTARARCSSSTPTRSSTRAGRRTTCGPSTSRRSSRPSRRSATCPATPPSSRKDDLAANDCNLNIRRYADNAAAA